jgi:hypothetical protein
MRHSMNVTLLVLSRAASAVCVRAAQSCADARRLCVFRFPECFVFPSPIAMSACLKLCYEDWCELMMISACGTSEPGLS